MVTHETYRARTASGSRRPRCEIDADGGERRARLIDTGEPVEIGDDREDVEVEAQHGRPGRDRRHLRRRRRALFVLSDSPPERDVNWTEAGVEGAYKQTQRLWRLVCEIERVVGAERPARPEAFGDEAQRIRQIAHAALARIEDEIERLRFNVCIAQIYEFANALSAAVGAIEATPVADDLRWAFAEAGDILVHGFAPMMPHLAEECWEVLGHDGFVAQSPWPAADRSLIVSDSVTLVVQVNGKKRGEVTVARDAGDAAIEKAALALDAVVRAMDNKPARKVIIVPGRIVNVVV